MDSIHRMILDVQLFLKQPGSYVNFDVYSETDGRCFSKRSYP